MEKRFMKYLGNHICALNPASHEILEPKMPIDILSPNAAYYVLSHFATKHDKSGIGTKHG